MRLFRGREMEAGDHLKHMRQVDAQQKRKGRCEHCGSEWDIEEEDPNQLELGLPEGSQAPRPQRG